jgi:POT family proton-dependent oligopeptide transporter
MRNKYGWGYAFATAGVGMFIGIATFLIGLKYYKHVDVLKPTQAEDMSLGRIFMQVFLPAIVVGAGAWFFPGNIFGSDSTDAFIFATIPVIIFYAGLYVNAAKEDRRPIAALLSIFAVSIMFWAVFKQNGTALTTWAQYYTDREMPALVEGTAKDLYLAEKVVYQKDSVNLYNEKFQLVKANSVAVKTWDYPVYYRNMAPELKPNEGEETFLFNTELFQSINPFWVIALTPLVVAFFSYLKRVNLEISTATKIAFGLLISAVSTLVMAAAVYAGSNGAIKVSPMWLISCYAVITVGELFLSPMGLSLVSKLSPKRITALMMGGWFLATSLGNKLSGILATLWDGYAHKSNFFFVNGLLLGGAAIIMFFMLRWLNGILKEHL